MAKNQPHNPKPSPKISKKETKVAGENFFAFIKAKEQWLDWGIAASLLIAILVFLKICFPIPCTESDSGNYILSAASGKINGYRPYGYSAFLRFFHNFSENISFITTWQWLLTAFSSLFFLFTVKFIFRPSKITFLLLMLLTLLNPSIIFLDAYVMSDSLFVSLTLLFLTTGFWLVYNASYWMAAIHLLLLYWCIDARYIGLFYPIFAAVFLFLGFREKNKWLAIGTAVIPLLIVLIYRSNATDAMKEEFGQETFSAFSGWQRANNAVAVLPYVKVNADEIQDPQLKTIHQIIRSFPDSLFSTKDIIATNFMWVKSYPGKAVLFQYIQQTQTPYLQAWVAVGVQMEKYGAFLQDKYKSEYFTHFILPNFKNIFEVFEINEGTKFTADANIKSAFAVDVDTYEYKHSFFKPLTGIRKIGDLLVWMALLLSVIAGLIFFKKLQFSTAQLFIIGGALLFIGAFLGASVIAAPINNFRYIMPIYFMQIVVPVLVLERVMKSFKK